jgi:ribosomal protein L40E
MTSYFRPIPPIETNNGLLYVSDLQMNFNRFGNEHEIDFQLIADGKAASDFYNSLQDALHNGTSFPMGMNRVQNTEFMCLWCGSINPITNRHCSQCGGPRGFVLGNSQ